MHVEIAPSRPLLELMPGSVATVHSLGGPSQVTAPLMECGIRPGVEVRIIRRAPLGCPMEVAVGSARMAIRCESLEAIRVVRDDA